MKNLNVLLMDKVSSWFVLLGLMEINKGIEIVIRDKLRAGHHFLSVN